ncbi:MAG: hypothetical protein JXR05_14715 [Flavobacteriaceae bacterium]
MEFNDNILIFWHIDDYGKTTKKYELNAEPWNEIYSQIRNFKIDFEKPIQKE